MITPTTQAAIAVLSDIYCGNADHFRSKKLDLSEKVLCVLLHKLSAKGLIHLIIETHPELLTSYEPTKAPNDLSLLDILEATGEHLNCNYPTSEEFYMRYGKAAHKLGVVNHMTRLYLEEIKLFDL